jgi:hypothetical protein
MGNPFDEWMDWSKGEQRKRDAICRAFDKIALC